MNTMQTSAILAATLSVVLAGCETMSPEEIELRERHLVAFAWDGAPIAPDSDLQGWDLGNQHLVQPHYAQQVRKITRSARIYLKRRQRTGKSGRVAVFIHGGLNDYGDSIDRLRASAEEMKRDGVYPIFVAWDSDLIWSYFDNLVYEDGSQSPVKWFVFPVVLIRDFAAGIINIPVRAVGFGWDYLIGSPAEDERAASVAQFLYMLGKASQSETDSAADQAMGKIRGKSFVSLPELPEYRPEGLRNYYYYDDYFSPRNLLRPVGVATSFLVDAFGKGAWEGMLRRTKRLFDKENLNSIYREDQYTGLSLLMVQLRDLQSSLRHGENGLEVNRSQQGLELLERAIQRLLDKLADKKFNAETKQFLDYLNRVVENLRQLKGNIGTLGWLRRWLNLAPTFPQGPDPQNQSTKTISEGMVELMVRIVDPDLRQVIRWLLTLSLLPHEIPQATAALDAVMELFSPDKNTTRKPVITLDILLAHVEKNYAKGVIKRADAQAVLHSVLGLVRQRLDVLRSNEVEVQIFAHSMGAIVVNEILRRSDRYATPNFKRIVYMAPACSIRDYEDSVFPYLFRQKSYGTQFHNVMLHPVAEEKEMMLYDILPRGSLLVYIDEYLTNPGTRRDRTLGRFQNIMLSLQRTRASVAGQIHMKVFSAGRGSKQKVRAEAHTEFAPAKFWKEEFWGHKKPETPKWHGRR